MDKNGSPESTLFQAVPGPTSPAFEAVPGPKSPVFQVVPGPTSPVFQVVPGPTSPVFQVVPGPASRPRNYENVDLFKNSEDPFGEDFEAALLQGINARVKKTSVSSVDSSTPSTTPQHPATPSKGFAAQYTESPPIPIKKCSRSHSRVSRNSTGSCGSEPVQKQYSYDQVSLSSNFSKPVIHVVNPADMVYDVFSNISFSSPLSTSEEQNCEDSTSSQGRNMNSLDSNISSLNIGERIQTYSETNSEADEEVYENIDEIRQKLEKNTRALAPEPPPRNSILKPEVERRPEVEENVYSECSVPGRSVLVNDEQTLFDRLLREPSCGYSEGLADDKVDLGARPKSSKTIDIRTTVHKWYEEAAEEVERDLSLDIQHLEKNDVKKRSPTKKSSYEYVFLATTGRIDGDTVVPPPANQLLRDFDPCFGDDFTEPDENTDTEDTDNLKSEKNSDLKTDARSRSNPDGLEPAEAKAAEASAEFKNKKHSPKKSLSPKTKFPIGSPKKINFGPPKPPRSFDCSSVEVLKKDQQSRSAKDLFNITSKRKQNKDDSNDDIDALKVEIKKEAEKKSEDNLYVTLPVRGKCSSPGSDVNNPSPPTSAPPPLPPSTPSPPPLPASNPPSASKPKQTMYENVWIERGSPVIAQDRDSTTPSIPRERKKDSFTHPISKEERNDSSTPPLPREVRKVSSTPPLPREVRKVSSTPSIPREGRKDSFTSSIPGEGSTINPSTPPSVPPRAGRKGGLHRKSDSLDSGSSSTTTDSTQSKDLLDPVPLAPGNNEGKKLKKVPSVRAFSVASMNKLGKLPELADNIKRRMSDQLKPVNAGPRYTPPGSYAPSLNPQDTPNDSEDDDNSDTMSDFTTRRRASMFLPENKSKNNSGAIYVLSRRKKQFYCKWCVLGEGLLKWFNEDTSLARPKETIMLSNIFSVTKRTEKHIGTSLQELYCFDIAVVNSKGKFCVYMLGLQSNLEREVWMEKIVQSLGSRLSTFSMVGCKRIGWAYLKAGFAAEWSLAWLYLADRYIVYATQDSIEFEKIDLKKTKDVFVRKDSKNLCLPLGFTKQPVLVCDFNDRSLYILLGVVDEVEVWRSHIEDIAFTNNNILADQQVTHEDVPVIVDKCVKFVFSHGVMTEGIYRLAGVNTKINKLLSQFRSNAWAVQISRENFSEHDVANVLKRFVRQLDKPLLTEYLKESFLNASQIEDSDVKLKRYKDLLNQLPKINYTTMRKILGHLYTIAEQCEKNLMPVYNLAPLWGPNILIVDGQEQGFGETSRETEVCADLISNYPYLFNVDMEELDKEKRLLDVLEKINYPTPSTVKRSGDVRMWCYIETRTCGKCVSISLHPSLTAGEAVLLVAKEANLQEFQNMLIHEVVLGETLERPVHFSEKLLDLTLRWGSWQDADRHNNYLLLKENKLYEDAVPCAIPPLSIFSEIQFSDNKPKSKFSKLLFSVSNASITCYKEDKSGQSSEISAWPVEDLIWYIGCEKKRNPPHPLNLTFIDKDEPLRTKEAPLFGRVLSFSSRELFTKWLAALLVAEYGTNIVQNNLVILD